MPDQFLVLITQYGFPLVFIFGLIQGWWFLKPHVQLIEKTLERALAQVQDAKVNEERSYGIAEESHQLAQMALDQGKLTNQSIKEVRVEITSVHQAIRDLQLEMAREGKK